MYNISNAQMSRVQGSSLVKEKAMSKRAFSISGKFEENGKWSERPSDFSGYFILDEVSGTIKGYMEELYESPYDPLRFICGVMNGKQLAYFKLSNEKDLDPLVYLFSDITQKGMWGVVLPLYGEIWIQGDATVEIDEIPWSEELSKTIEDKYSKMTGGCLDLNSQVEKLVPNLSIWLDNIS